MNKKEKEVIKTLKNIVIQEYDWWINKGDYAESNVKEVNDAIKIILDLYQKEKEKNKKLKELLQKKNKYTHELEKDLFEGCSNYVISKDKIREKIKELRKKEDEISKLDYELEPEKAIDCILMRIADLQELLEE